MALSAHEMILVLRARDEASRILRSFSDRLRATDKEAAAAASAQFARGAALATAGVAVAGSALAIGQAFNSAANAAVEYNEKVALTVTQLDDVNLSFQQVRDMGLAMAREMPVQFEEIQDSLYDIFSSIETDGPGAEKILRGIGQAAIGGKVDMQTAGRGILQIMNAWKLGAEDVTHINDVMFQLVRKGVGTYEEFSKTMGRSIPSALKAGQSVEDLAGMMAFLTRNGLSTAMASTAAARALDAISKPATIKRFEELGIAVTDAQGKFRPMADIAGELREKLANMTPKEAAAKLQDLFKGSGGTIQAMRFFNLAVQDGQGLLQSLTDDMHNAGGAAQEAYDVMANTPAAKLQEMRNQWEVMKVEIGDRVLPVKLKLAEILMKLFDAFNNLSPGMKDFIVKAAMIGTTVMLIVGVLMAIIGTFLMFSAAATMAGVGLGTIAAVVGGVVVGLGALVAIGVLVYKNWETIKQVGLQVWEGLKAGLSAFLSGFSDFAQNVIGFGKEVWGYLGPIFQRLWDVIVTGVMSLWPKIQPPLQALGESFTFLFDNLKTVGERFGNVLIAVFNFLKPVFYALVGVIGVVVEAVTSGLGPAFEFLGGLFSNLLSIISGAVNIIVGLLTGDWSRAWQGVKDIVLNTFGAIGNLVMGVVTTVIAVIGGFVKGIIDFFKHLWDVLVGHSIVPDMITAIITWFGTLPGKVLAFVNELVTKAIAFFLSLAIKAAAAALDLVTGVVGFFSGLPGKVLAFVNNLVHQGVALFLSFAIKAAAAALDLVFKVVNFFAGLPGKAISAISSLAGQLKAQGVAWFVQLVSAVSTGILNTIAKVREIPGKITNALKGFSLRSIGLNIANSLGDGIKAAVGNVTRKARELAKSAIDAAKNFFGIGSPSKVFTYFGEMNGLGLANGLGALISRVKAAGKRLAEAAVTPIESSTFEPVVFGMPRPALPGSVSGGSSGGFGADGLTINQTINTQEINPVKHAADLGYELARRLGA